MDKTDLWVRTFVAALDRYGEEQAPKVADRAVKAFEERFSPPSPLAPIAAAATQKPEPAPKSEPVSK